MVCGAESNDHVLLLRGSATEHESVCQGRGVYEVEQVPMEDVLAGFRQLVSLFAINHELYAVLQELRSDRGETLRCHHGAT
jgi:hypothetical protein